MLRLCAAAALAGRPRAIAVLGALKACVTASREPFKTSIARLRSTSRLSEQCRDPETVVVCTKEKRKGQPALTSSRATLGVAGASAHPARGHAGQSGGATDSIQAASPP